MAQRAPIPLRRPEEALFSLLVQSVVDYAIFLLDPQGNIVSWNQGAQRIKGYAPEEIIGRHFSIFYPPQEVRRGKPQYGLRVATEEGRWEEENWRVRKDGTRFWASVVLTALRNEAGELVGFAKVTRDLTERRQAEEERSQLLRMERQARQDAETALDQLRAIQSLTEAALAHLGLDDLLDILLARIAELLDVDTAAILVREGDVLVARAANGIEDEVEQGVRIPIGVGFAGRVAAERRPVILDDVEHADVLNPLLRRKGIRSIMGVPLLVEGNVLGVVHVGTLHPRRFTRRDSDLLQMAADRAALALEHSRLLTFSMAAEQEARAATEGMRLRDEFLSIAAHELRTPVAGLLVTSQHLRHLMERGREIERDRLQERLQLIEQQASKLNKLIAQLLDVTRLDTGKLGLEPVETDLASLVETTVANLAPQLGGHPVEVRIEQRPVLWLDPLRIEQVLTNLLTNAAKFSPPGSPVLVEVGQSSPEIAQVAVRDWGTGIPPERRAGIFERFFQAHSDQYRSGMGLGLYVSREIVQLHQGTIVAEFPPDGGSRFVVSLPRTGAEPRQTSGD